MNGQSNFGLPQPALYVYRSSSVAMLRRYFQMSIEIGRLPALLGREFFRSRSDTVRKAWFEDAVIYVHDVERCILCLRPFDQDVIARVILQDYEQEDAARLLHCTARHLRRRLAVALDVLTQLFLERKLMVIVEAKRPDPLIENLPVPEDPEGGDASSVADELSAAAGWDQVQRVPMIAPDDEWRRVPVEISCQAPRTSQFTASC